MMRRGGEGRGEDNLHGEVILGSHLGASPLNSLNFIVKITKKTRFHEPDWKILLLRSRRPQNDPFTNPITKDTPRSIGHPPHSSASPVELRLRVDTIPSSRFWEW
jgi:hypothetical protein